MSALHWCNIPMRQVPLFPPETENLERQCLVQNFLRKYDSITTSTQSYLEHLRLLPGPVASMKGNKTLTPLMSYQKALLIHQQSVR